MNLKEQRAAALAAAQGIIKKAKDADVDLTEDEQSEVEAKFAEIDELDKKIEAAQKSSDLIGRLESIKEPERSTEVADAFHVPPEQGGKAKDSGSIAGRFVGSEAFQGFRKAHPSGVGSGTPIHIEAKGIGSVADLGIGTKATAGTLDSTTGQWDGQQRLPGYRSDLIDEPVAFLDLVTVGSTQASYLEYAKVVSENDNAAIVAEGALKPLSDIATDNANAKAYTYADGFDVTNQTLSDSGALVAFMDARIRWHLRNLIEDKLLNGTGAGTEPEGILHTTGTQAQAFDTDVVTTLAGALQKVEDVQATPQAIVMNPADAWKLSLTKDANGVYLLGSPLQQSLNPTPFGVRLVKSNRVAAGTALVGNFSSVQFLQREALSVLAFNQHKDYAQKNMSYVRAELRALQMIYAPREIVIADLTAV